MCLSRRSGCHRGRSVKSGKTTASAMTHKPSTHPWMSPNNSCPICVPAVIQSPQRNCRRGTKELDILLERFAVRTLHRLDDAGLDALERFLGQPGPGPPRLAGLGTRIPAAAGDAGDRRPRPFLCGGGAVKRAPRHPSSASVRPARLRPFALERIQQFHFKALEITNVSRNHRQSVDSCRGRDHGVLDQGVRFAMHETRPLPEDMRVHRQDTISIDYPIKPGFQFARLHRILLASDLDPCLDLSNRNGRQEQPFGRNPFDPVQHRLVWSGSAKFRNDVGIEQVHQIYSKATVGRW